MIQKELIKLRKDIKRIRRSKKIKVLRNNYITYDIFLQRLYSYSFDIKKRFERVLDKHKEYLREIIAKKQIFKKYSIKIKYLEENPSNYYIELDLFKNLENNTFKIIKELIKNNNKVKASKVYLLSSNSKDKKNKLSNIGFNYNIYKNDFYKTFTKYFNLDKKLIKNKLYGNIEFTNKQIQQDSENYNQGYNYRDTLLNGNCFKFRLYIIKNGTIETTKKI